MVGTSKILTVSYGTFSCTLEGFDDPFAEMRSIAEYFRDLAADDRYFGAEPPRLDAETMKLLAQAEAQKQITASMGDSGVVLRQTAVEPAEPAEADQSAESRARRKARERAELKAAARARVMAAREAAVSPPSAAPETIADKMSRIRAAVARSVADEAPANAPSSRQTGGLRPISVAFADVAGSGEDDFDADDGTAFDDEEARAGQAGDYDTSGAESFGNGAASDAGTPHHSFEDVSSAAELTEVFQRLDDAEAEVFDPEPEAAGEAAEAPRLVRARLIHIHRHEDTPGEAADDETVHPSGAEGAGFMRDALEGHEEAEGPEGERRDPFSPATAEEPAGEGADAAPEDFAAFESATPTAFAPAVVAADAEDEDDESEGAPLVDPFDDSEITAEAVNEAAQPGVGDDVWEEDDAAAEPSAVVIEAQEPLTLTPEFAAEATYDLEDANAPSTAFVEAGEAVEPSEFAAGVEIPDVDFAEATADDAEEADEVSGITGEQHSAVLFAWEQDAVPDQFEADDEESDAAPDAEVAAGAAHPASATAETEDEADTSLSPEDEAALLRDLAEVEREVAESRKARDGKSVLEANRSAESSVSRILRETESQLDDSEASRRRATIAHLKAAVAATRADRDETDEPKADEGDEDLDRYRDDLDRVVRPHRPSEERVVTRPRKLAPLMLVSEQRIDLPAYGPGADVQPRRITAGNLALDDDDEDFPEFGDLSGIEQDTSFADYARTVGATGLTDLIEAAAAYAAYVQGRPAFTRPTLLRQVAGQYGQSLTREDALRAFGSLLRQGKIQKLRRGQFSITKASRYHPG
jgi:hypothetical protein